MAKFVVDCGVVLKLARDQTKPPAKHELLAPTLLRSQTLSAVQADAFVTLDKKLARQVQKLVRVAPIGELKA